MTKEEIWNKNVAGWKLVMTDKGHANALAAMDEHSKQQSIAFLKYLLEKRYLDTDDEGSGIQLDYNYLHTEQFDMVAEVFYNQFIEQQNKDNETING